MIIIIIIGPYRGSFTIRTKHENNAPYKFICFLYYECHNFSGVYKIIEAINCHF